MATRSLIGIKIDQYEIRAIYCHSDGYPSYNGSLLLAYYPTKEKVEALINLGGISLLGHALAPISEYAEPRSRYAGCELVKHSFETPQKGVTVAYHRDRGEKLDILTYHSETRFNNREREGVDYTYLFKDGQWYVNGCLLTADMCREK